MKLTIESRYATREKLEQKLNSWRRSCDGKMKRLMKRRGPTNIAEHVNPPQTRNGHELIGQIIASFASDLAMVQQKISKQNTRTFVS